jgi:hypothetical protein
LSELRRAHAQKQIELEEVQRAFEQAGGARAFPEEKEQWGIGPPSELPKQRISQVGGNRQDLPRFRGELDTEQFQNSNQTTRKGHFSGSFNSNDANARGEESFPQIKDKSRLPCFLSEWKWIVDNFAAHRVGPS